MKNNISILQSVQKILDALIILAVLFDYLFTGLSNWLIICFILFIPSNILYFALKKKSDALMSKNQTKKTTEKKEKALVTIK